ncbi:hypothetical protein BDZ94DRAFT_193829 [Collybia nuda]|uniref:F-box domain-containing protein n=1 Tax=Collybia nuda TaxID=64659 RepID=A0A9P5XVZ6_9AGAR|nr:hypothetical protein BDZ94DRAFT_193829 [Collybia nuda]
MECGGTDNFLDLPYSNQPVSQAHVARAYIKLKTLRTELSQVDVELSLLLARRAHLVNGIARCKSVFAPHKKLPPELIREIISTYAVIVRISALPLDKEEQDPRLVVTQICSSWRQIAFGIPELWNVTFSCNDPPHGSVRLANSWLQQCHSSALVLKTRRRKMSAASQWLSRANFVLTDLVIPLSRRITTLDLDIDVAQWAIIQSHPFDQLTTLYLQSKVISITNHPREVVFCPSPHSVHFKGTKDGDDIRFLPGLPWTQLTNISLSGYFVISSLPSFLSQCISLRTMSLEINRLDTASITPLPDVSIHLPCLESLSMLFPSLQLFDLLSLFCGSRLSHVKLDTLPRNEQAIWKFTGFISSISDTLRRFEIARAGWHGFMRQEYISPMTSLTHFIVPYGHFFTLSELALIGTRDILPNIEHLGFSVNQSEDKVVDMLVTRHEHESRTTRGLTLKTVNILSQNICWGDSDRSKLLILRSQGMNISLVRSRF